MTVVGETWSPSLKVNSTLPETTERAKKSPTLLPRLASDAHNTRPSDVLVFKYRDTLLLFSL